MCVSGHFAAAQTFRNVPIFDRHRPKAIANLSTAGARQDQIDLSRT